MELTKNELKLIKKILKTNLYVDTVKTTGCGDRIRFFIYSNKTILNVSEIIFKLLELENARYNLWGMKLTKYKENSIDTIVHYKYILEKTSNYLNIILNRKDINLFAIIL